MADSRGGLSEEDSESGVKAASTEGSMLGCSTADSTSIEFYPVDRSYFYIF